MRSDALSEGRHLAFHLPAGYHEMFMKAVTSDVRDRNPAGDFLIIGLL